MAEKSKILSSTVEKDVGEPPYSVTIHDAHEHAVPGERGLKRGLKNRHIAMISIGGVIGTGLFLGTAGALQRGGPLGLWLGYCVIGSVAYSVMIGLGEMVALLPVEGGHIKLAERFVDPSWAFTMGWNYAFNWLLILPAELSAAAVLISYWDKNTSAAVYIIVCLVVVVFINALGPGAYGEAEFWFASIKVLTVVGLIILGLVIDLGGGPNHDRLGFRYWKDPGPFVQYLGYSGAKGRILGFWSSLTQAAFSYIGLEIVAIAAGETKNPRRNIPKAIKRVYIRILLFYLFGTFVLGLIVASNDPGLDIQDGTAAGSPWVIAIKNSGISGLPHLINACILTSAWSAGSSDIYTSSRALYALALSRSAPAVFKKTTKHGLPWAAVTVASLFGLLALMSIDSGAGKVFNWFVNLTAVAGLMTWFGISITYLRFYYGLKLQGIDRSDFPYRSALNPYAAWWAAFATFTVCFFSGYTVFLNGKWDTASFVTNYLPLPLFFILYLGHKLIYKTKLARTHNMDFISGVKEAEATDIPEPPPVGFFAKVWDKIM